MSKLDQRVRVWESFKRSTLKKKTFWSFHPRFHLRPQRWYLSRTINRIYLYLNVEKSLFQHQARLLQVSWWSLVPQAASVSQIGRVDDIWLLNIDPNSLKPVAEPFGTTPNSMNPSDMIWMTAKTTVKAVLLAHIAKYKVRIRLSE